MSKKLLVAGLLPVVAIAAPQQTEQTMVVTATRIAEPEASVLAPINVVTRDEIEKMQARSVIEVLQTLPGVQFSRNGGMGQTSNLLVRGGSSAQTLVLVDGVRTGAVLSGSTELNQIPVHAVERIEYIRGARASIYGSDAITGVINIITRGQKGDNRHKFDAGAGSLDHQATDWSSSIDVAKGGHLKAAAGYDTENGYNVHPIPGINDGDKHGFLGRNAMLDYQQQLNEQLNLFGAARWVRNSAEYDSSSTYSHSRKETWDENQFYQLGGRFQPDRYQSELQANYGRQQAFNYPDSSDRHQATYATYTDVYNSSWTNNLLINEALNAGAGIDWRREVLLDKSTAGDDWMNGGALDYADGDISRNNTGLYALGQYQQHGVTAELSGRTDDNQQYGRHNTWQVGAGWNFYQAYRLSGSYGTAFRAPTFTDLYYPGASNPDLKPEESDNIELTLEGSAFEAFWRVTAYRNLIDNMLQWDNAAYTMSNLGSARLRGIEAETEFTTGMLTHKVSANFSDPEDLDNGQQLIRRAKRDYKWLTQAQWQKLDGSLTWNYQGPRYDNYYDPVTYDASRIELGGYSLWDLALGYHFTGQFTLQGKVNNLFDKRYETATGYPASERTYFVNASYQL